MVKLLIRKHITFLRESNPEAWSQLDFLMDHEAERRKEEEYWKMFQVKGRIWKMFQVREKVIENVPGKTKIT